MAEWKLTTLGSVATISSGSTPPAAGGDFDVMGANGRIGSAFKANFGPGYLVGRVGAAGAVTRVVSPCWASDNTLTLVPNAATNEAFLGHMLTALDLDHLATKTAQPLVTQTELRKRQISLPPLEEQRRIAEILDTIDQTIQASERVMAKSALIEQGFKWDLVGHRSGSDDGWEQVTIGDLGQIVTGGTPPTGDERYWHGSVPFITPGDIDTRGDICSTDRRVTQLGARLGKRIPPGSVAVVSIGSTIGKVGRVHESSVTNQQINTLIPSAEYDNEFVACVLELARPKLESEAGRQAVPIVNAKTLRSLFAYVCSLDLQREIGAQLVSLRDRIKRERSGLAKLRKLRTGLAADLLSGRVPTVAT